MQRLDVTLVDRNVQNGWRKTPKEMLQVQLHQVEPRDSAKCWTVDEMSGSGAIWLSLISPSAKLLRLGMGSGHSPQIMSVYSAKLQSMSAVGRLTWGPEREA